VPIIALGALIAGGGCVGLFGITHDTGYAAMATQLVAMGGGLGLLVPPLTSTLLGSVNKAARSGVAAGVLNATRQTGSVLGVALFGSFITSSQTFVLGARAALVTSTALLVAAAAVVAIGARGNRDG
jgi:DHA2 family methylenomycin A resistance protein-like MFS transporter